MQEQHRASLPCHCQSYLQPLRDGLDGAATPLVGDRHARAGVVKVGDHMELQQGCEFSDDVLRRPIFLLLLQAAVGLDDLGQLVRQVVFAPASRCGHSVKTVAPRQKP